MTSFIDDSTLLKWFYFPRQTQPEVHDLSVCLPLTHDWKIKRKEKRHF